MSFDIQRIGIYNLDVKCNPRIAGEAIAMRKSREEAAQTRKRIVTTAASEFRKNGIVATGLADLMNAAGLTHGGFYKHFESKDQLVAEACAEAVETAICDGLAAAASKGGGAVEAYLSTGHRDNPATGCPLSALGSELARSNKKTRAAATAGFLELVEIIAGQFGRLPPAAARRRALVAVSTMIGALTMSRIVTAPELSAEILKEAKKTLADR